MQPQKWSLPEEFSLVALIKESGYYEGGLFQPVEFFTGAACLMELFYQQKLAERNKKVVLIDDRPTGIAYLDVVLDQVREAQGKKNLHTLLLNLGGKHLKIKDRVAERLVELQILEPVKKHVMHILPVGTYVAAKPEIREGIIQRMKEQIFGSDLPDQRMLGLMLLLKQARLWKMCFSAEEQSLAEARLESMQAAGTDPLSFYLAKTVGATYKSLAAPKWESYGV